MASTHTRGRVLRGLRTERGLTQSQLARAIDVENQSISLWENDKVEISSQNLLRLVEFFGVEPEVLGYEVPGTMSSSSLPPQLEQWMTDRVEAEQEILRLLRRLERRVK